MTINRLLASALSVFLMMSTDVSAQDDLPFDASPVTSFDEPWALAFLPDGRMLVTEKKGNLYIVTQDGEKSRPVGGMPDVDYGGQGGLGDVALHPGFGDNGFIYLSYAEGGIGGTRGAAVTRAVLNLTERGGYLSDAEVIWRQYPKVVGFGHYGHRLLFDKDGYLWISSGDRQKFTPAQDMQSNIGKILRLNDDGSVPDDNPFVNYIDQDPLVDDEGVYGQIWSIGHRNPLGIAIDLDGQLWVIEMGPAGGDELNRVVRGGNYGYPIISSGDHYDGRDIPDHDTRREYLKPAVWWTPVISPGGLMVYSGKLFDDWHGDLLVAGLSSEALVRLEVRGDEAREVNRYPMGARIRGVAQGPDGALWVLEDERGSSQGRLLKLTPAN
ncbi:MAG: PQQ-dependent sugar dehydrogenase [Gammaproteobacteria bacterium]|nr:PQQ-dependent sugar dehydrogenase [Gammaproteobacteria bacterium]MDH3362417.1 PQQ-dependent sugar dehydrogenase [Gammaproteobacteria bacterium]MDH3481423.1 PQQ-dependent sugar dehydrogenase [Gammaproteobacteria bacterium]